MEEPGILETHIKSKKFLLSIITSGLIFITGMLAGRFPSLQPHLQSVYGALLGVLAIYTGGNVIDSRSPVRPL